MSITDYNYTYSIDKYTFKWYSRAQHVQRGRISTIPTFHIEKD